MYLQVQLDTLAEVGDGDTRERPMYTDEIGNMLIEQVDLEIGGQKIDEHFSEWLSIWSELNLSHSQKGNTIDAGYNAMVGRGPFKQLADGELSRIRFARSSLRKMIEIQLMTKNLTRTT